MSQAVFHCSYKLVEGASEADFLAASEVCCKEVLSKLPGFISWQMLKNGDTWIDLVTFKTMADANATENGDYSSPAAQNFFAFIDFATMKQENYSVEKSF